MAIRSVISYNAYVMQATLVLVLNTQKKKETSKKQSGKTKKDYSQLH